MTAPRPPGDTLLRIGMVVTGIGLLITLVAILPLVFTTLHLPSVMWLLSLTTGVGLLIIFAGLARGARSRRTR